MAQVDAPEARGKILPERLFDLVALREVQRARVPSEDKFKMFISAGDISKTYQLDEILAAITKEGQTATWTESAPLVCDFIRIPGRGIRFTCTSRSVANKLDGSAIRIFGADFIIKAASMFDRMYYVNLKNVASELDDGVIYDYFKQLGLSPLITPTFQVGSLTSRDRTVWFNTQVCPKE
ncbi:hypothetical protein G195_011697 [Phytophthora kernoviae 00238/432]|uniref:Uncharacterized protein n=1 Tax=Phytophthora kernoviae 00238/432 TaxID=1284355 RepID=A0A8J4S5U5_9STRA|nr:hypothetical protein G195_011697 [Phytophthora kernoviae 00238/432]